MKAATKRAAALFIPFLMNSFTMLAATTATQLVFTSQPANTTVGAGITNVVVQLAANGGKNVAQSGIAIVLTLSKGGGLNGTTNKTTDASGKATFTNLKISQPGNGDTFSAVSTGLQSATSSAFNVVKGTTTIGMVASTNFLVYGQSVTFTASVGVSTPASGTPTGTVTFKDGAATLGTAALNVSGIATFSTNRISAATTNHTLTAVYAGDSNFSNSTSGNLSLATGKLALTVAGVVANNRAYDGTTNATLNFSNATLATVLAGDTVTLNSAAAKGAFANKTTGTNKAVAISGLALAGASAGNYSVSAPTVTANITPRGLAITAQGVNKTYDGTTNASVTLTDNRVAGDVLTNGYATAAFTNKNAGTNLLIKVSGLAIAGTDSANYNLSATNTAAAANISPALLTVAAGNLTRPYATTNPVLVAIYSGFVAGESLTNSDLTGGPALTTPANTNSSVGTYPITISQGSLASLDYSLKFTNDLLTVTKVDTATLLSTTLNPALTNQNITFAARVTPLVSTVVPTTGVIQFKSNGTNKLGNAVSVSSGLANLTVLAATLGQNNTVITAEYSDPAGNFNSSTNSLTQNILAVITPPPPSKLSLAPSFANGNVTAHIAGLPGQAYVIQASVDLAHWISLSTNIADATGVVFLVDSNAVAFPSRYYRAYSP